MTRRILVACVATAALLASAGADAGQICSLSLTTGTGSPGVYSSAVISFGDFDSWIEMGSVPMLFDDVARTAADAGATLTATSADPHFAPVVQRLTNGVHGDIYFGFGGNLLGDAENVTFLAAGYTPPNDIDLQGFTIDTITLTINTLSFNSPGSNPNGDGNWTNASYACTVRIYGAAAAVPEPATMILLGTGALGVFGCARRRRRK